MLLRIAEVQTHAAFFFRVPTAESLETFIGEEVFPYRAFLDVDGALNWFMRWRAPDNRTLSEFLRSQESQSLRQLWEVSKALSKKDIAALTEDRIEGQAPKKISLPMARDLESRARALGLADAGTYEKPGPLALAKINANHAPGAVPKHVAWEDFTSIG